MKKLKVIIVLLSIFLFCTAYKDSNNDNLGKLSINGDTLYLINNDLGQRIAKIWDLEPKPEDKKPIILFVNKL